MEPIILASSSPRRQEILKNMKIPYQVIMPNINENNSSDKNPMELTESLARAKVQAVVHSLPPKQVIPWILGADTIVSINNKNLGKPSSPDEAFEYIKTLQGKTHTVCTSIALYNGTKKSTVTKTAVAKVTFAFMAIIESFDNKKYNTLLSLPITRMEFAQAKKSIVFFIIKGFY